MKHGSLLTDLRRHRGNGLFKTATTNGGNEKAFEQSFFSLAYAYMKDKAPRLLDFMVGFQLVDRNEDNTKAVGLFGFRLDKQWLYAPTFFLNGDLKGHELLYIKQEDSFVPMQENWVNYLLSRRPHTLGEGSPQSTFELGGYPPNFRDLSTPPSAMGKYSSDEWLKPALPLIAALMSKQANVLYPQVSPGVKLAFDNVVESPSVAALQGIAGKFSMDKVLPGNFALLKSAFEFTQRYPAIKRGFDEFYGRDCFSRWAKECKQQSLQESFSLLDSSATKTASDSEVYVGNSLIPEVALPEHTTKTGALRIYVYQEHSITRNGEELDETGKKQLTQDELADLSSNGYLVKDERKGDEISKAYNTQVEQSLTNPGESGFWNMLEKPGSFSKMLVISHPVSNNGPEGFCTVVRTGDGGNKAWLNAHSTSLWAERIEDQKEFDDWFESLGDRTSLQKGGIYIAVGPRGQGTTPFRVNTKHDDGQYTVNFKTRENFDDRRSSDLPTVHSSGMSYGCDSFSSYDAVMHVDAEERHGKKLKAIQGELRVPAEYKFLKLKSPPKPSRSSGYLMDECCDDAASSEPAPIAPGRIDDLQMLFHEKTARLKIYDDHNEVSMTSPYGLQRMQKKAAVISLVRDHGFTEHTASCMLKQAAVKQQQVFRVRYAPGFGDKTHLTKQAMPHYSALSGGPSAPMFPQEERGVEVLGGRNTVQAMYPDEQFSGVEEMDSSRLDPSVHDIWQNYTHEDFQNTVGTAQQAAESGQKEVFDTAMISNMLKAVRQDSLVDRYLGDLMKALDKLGRILFMFYWHQEEFEDRYGKQDLPELEDSLRNSFEGLGDVVLFLKEKTVEPAFGTSGDIDLDEAARN